MIYLTINLILGCELLLQNTSTDAPKLPAIYSYPRNPIINEITNVMGILGCIDAPKITRNYLNPRYPFLNGIIKETIWGTHRKLCKITPSPHDVFLEVNTPECKPKQRLNECKMDESSREALLQQNTPECNPKQRLFDPTTRLNDGKMVESHRELLVEQTTTGFDPNKGSTRLNDEINAKWLNHTVNYW
eukprot:927693_1